MKIYNKLVRDKIPQIIEAEGKKPVTRYLRKDEYLQALIDKLGEEYEEFKADNSAEELADLQEVILALADALDITPGELAKTVSKKTLERGAFKKRIFLESVE
ncbi:MAG TPA: nucleoside triphosphate pyrophosphohydrolase [Candidatus Microsaccharimonas sp.]|nr:nucleoside triphosphate pyrophosphohydrolase [Candidatus Microsaccharimonas sp.]